MRTSSSAVRHGHADFGRRHRRLHRARAAARQETALPAMRETASQRLHRQADASNEVGVRHLSGRSGSCVQPFHARPGPSLAHSAAEECSADRMQATEHGTACALGRPQRSGGAAHADSNCLQGCTSSTTTPQWHGAAGLDKLNHKQDTKLQANCEGVVPNEPGQTSSNQLSFCLFAPSYVHRGPPRPSWTIMWPCASQPPVLCFDLVRASQRICQCARRLSMSHEYS